jgi:hypothetical protein
MGGLGRLEKAHAALFDDNREALNADARMVTSIQTGDMRSPMAGHRPTTTACDCRKRGREPSFGEPGATAPWNTSRLHLGRGPIAQHSCGSTAASIKLS